MLGVTVDDIIMVDGEFEVIAEGIEEASFYEGCRSSLNTRFALKGFSPCFFSFHSPQPRKGKGGKGRDQYLTTREAHSDNAELVFRRKELGGDGGRGRHCSVMGMEVCIVCRGTKGGGVL